jgi:hypothetical protein
VTRTLAVVAGLLVSGCGAGGGLPPSPPDDDDDAFADDDDAGDDDDSGSDADDDDSVDDDDDDDDDDDVGPPAPELFVNELSSDNEGAVLDDLGQPSDWFEIFNPGDAAVDLAGFTVSDDWTVPARHALPAGTVIPAGGFLVLWADGSAEPEGAHVPFRLASGGEAVGLFTPEGAVVDWVEFPPLQPDEAWARLPDGADEWMVVARGTPGATNVPLQIEQVEVVSVGADWRYLDTGIDPDPGWAALGFDDSAWAQGPAPLGYGDPVATEVSFGGDAGNKHITTWFRHDFEYAADPADATSLTLSLRIDDAALLWLNGEELIRVHLPTSGEITSSTLSTVTASGAAETAYTGYELPVGGLVEGANVLAVEVHQVGPGSSDIVIDLSLTAEVWTEGR